MQIKLLNDKYRLNKILDEDDKFIIFKGDVIDRPDLNVEIHVLKNKWVKDSDLVQKITNEYQGQEKLYHNGIVKIYDINYFKNIYYIVKEHYEGKTIDEMLRESYNFSLSEVINIITQLTRILGYAFKENLKLRSITSSDILITPDFKLKILRFRTPRNFSNEFDPTPTMSTDLFFIGTLMYELINKVSIFASSISIIRNLKNSSDISFDKNVSENIDNNQLKVLKNIVFKCLVPQKEKRYNSYEELLMDLKRVIQEEVDMNSVRNVMELEEKERVIPTPVENHKETKANTHIAKLTDAPEEYLMNEEKSEEDARDFLFTSNDYEYQKNSNIKIYIILSILLIFFTSIIVYIFY